jgi:hypothetical protein
MYAVNNGGFLATGVCSYFNDQVDKFGLANIRVSEQDTEDARSIQKYFGNVRCFGDNGVKMIYTVLPGLYELEYGRQPFPAGIYEDVFQFSASHDYDVLPRVGESEVDYYCRNLAAAIDNKSDFPMDKKTEVLETAKRLATKFCVGDKNRIYLIPIDNILNNFIRYAKKKIKITIKNNKIILYNDGDTIDENILNNIFTPYEKGIKGVFGLGSSIVKKTLHLLNYDITIENVKRGIERALNGTYKVSSSEEKGNVMIAAKSIVEGDNYDYYDAYLVLQVILFDEVIYG